MGPSGLWVQQLMACGSELVIVEALQVSTAMFRQAARIDKHLAQTSLPAGAGISAILNVP